MAKFQFSRLSESNLFHIGLCTLQRWGEIQADRYLIQLQDCCQRLADNPGLGRTCDEIRPGLRRKEQGRHVIFYREAATGGILISRILHQRMLPQNEAIDDDDTESV